MNAIERIAIYARVSTKETVTRCYRNQPYSVIADLLDDISTLKFALQRETIMVMVTVKMGRR